MQVRRTITWLTMAGALLGTVSLQGCGPAATLVIGQPDFTSPLPNQGKERAAANTLSNPAGAVAIYQDSLYVADSGNNRIMRFSPVPKENNASAAAIIQSVDPKKWLAFDGPYGISIDGGKMAVVDKGNNRVLLWNTVPAGSETPDVVLGQADLTSPSVADCAHLNDPRAVALGGGKLIVSDFMNSRILIWNSIPSQTNTKNPAAADVILGNRDCKPDVSASTRHTFYEPRGVWTDGTRLVVADTENNRVLIWNHIPAHPGDDADIVLGTGKAGAGRSQMNGPYGVWSDGTRLFVAEWKNHRVTMWNQFPAKDGEEPSAVFGQRNFNRSGSNGTAREGAGSPAPTERTMNGPQGVYYGNNQLWVTDSDNNRILKFDVK